MPLVIAAALDYSENLNGYTTSAPLAWNDVMEEIRSATNGGFALGNQRFQAEIAAMLGCRVQRGKPGRPRKQSDDVTEGRQPLSL